MEMDSSKEQERAEVKALASRLMHLFYCEGDAMSVAGLFAPEFTWFGAGEEQYIAGRQAAEAMFRQFQHNIPPCSIAEEEYDAIEPAPGIYVVSGRMWLTTAPEVELYARVHQRVTFVFQKGEHGFRCAHIHNSNPYQEMLGGEIFPEKIARQSYDYVQERLAELEDRTTQQNRQLEVVMASIAGGLKISNDDDTYSYAFVSKEAAALFGYTVEEFMAATGGTAVGAVYPPDLAHALADCAEAFKDGGLAYSTRYRVPCKDGSLKWVIDSGKKAQDAEGRWMVNSLYLDVTQEEEAAQRLKRQTELLTSIYDTVPCGILRFVKRAGGGYDLVSLNHAAAALLGYGDLESAARDWRGGVLGTVVEADRAMLLQMYQKLVQVGDRQDGEYRALWPDGSLHWLEATNMVVGKTAEGDAVIQRTIIDITQRILLQRQLESEQEMYRVAMESSADILFEYQMKEDRLITYEPLPGQGVARRELADYSKMLADGQVVHPEDAQAAIDNICKGRAEMFEARVRVPDGPPDEYFWHQISSRLIEQEGRPYRVVGTIRNIHTMKERLSENSQRLHMSQSALQAISGTYVCILYVNLTEDQYYAVRLPEEGDALAFQRAGGFSDELLRQLLQQVQAEDRPQVAQVCGRDALLSGVGGHREVEFRRGDPEGRGTWLRLEIHPVSVENADQKIAILTLRNVSQEKQQALERQAEEAAAKRALEEAYEGARRANHAKSEFLSRMSHDIRTPMNAILGMATIAEHSIADREKVADCLGKIQSSGGLLLGLINEVLDMSKIESGSVSLSEGDFWIDGMIDAVVQVIRPDLESKGQCLTLEKDVQNEAVCGDVMRVQQVLLNLLSNAVKYTGEGGHIRLAVTEKLSRHSNVGCYEFTVEDDGIGMTQQFQEKLFQPFERAEDPRVSQVQGTGLGLAIAQNLVQMMNGSIRVESQLDRGTRFTVTLFLKRRQQGAAAVPPEEEAPAAAAEFPPGTRLLLVEDNDINREIARELLEMAGLAIDCAADGRQGVEAFAAHPPGTYALILMDIQMPVMNGYQATEAIRRLGRTGERPDGGVIPIIALTANAFADDVYRARQAGMNEHVTKPLELDRLMATLHRWIDR